MPGFILQYQHQSADSFHPTSLLNIFELRLSSISPTANMQFTKIICFLLLAAIGANAQDDDPYDGWCWIGCVKPRLTLRPRAFLNMRRAADAAAIPEVAV